MRHRDALATAAATSQVTALSLLVSMYLQSVYAASSEEIEIFLSPVASRSRVREAVRGLAATRQIHSLSMDAQTYYFLEDGLPEFAEPAAHRRQRRTEPPGPAAAGRWRWRNSAARPCRRREQTAQQDLCARLRRGSPCEAGSVRSPAWRPPSWGCAIPGKNRVDGSAPACGAGQPRQEPPAPTGLRASGPQRPPGRSFSPRTTWGTRHGEREFPAQERGQTRVAGCDRTRGQTNVRLGGRSRETGTTGSLGATRSEAGWPTAGPDPVEGSASAPRPPHAGKASFAFP